MRTNSLDSSEAEVEATEASRRRRDDNKIEALELEIAIVAMQNP